MKLRRRLKKVIFLSETVAPEQNTIVVAAHSPFYDIVTVGKAKLHPDDEWDENLGRQLATVRALKKLTNKIERQAMGIIKHRDDIRKRKEKNELSNT